MAITPRKVCEKHGPKYQQSYKTTTGRMSVRYMCQQCAKWRMGETPERREARLRAIRKYHAKNKYKQYGVTVEFVNELRAQQESRCAICNTYSESLHLDHCHDTGKIRSMLCFKCNTGLGMFCDSSEIALRAYDYLRKHGK